MNSLKVEIVKFIKDALGQHTYKQPSWFVDVLIGFNRPSSDQESDASKSSIHPLKIVHSRGGSGNLEKREGDILSEVQEFLMKWGETWKIRPFLSGGYSRSGEIPLMRRQMNSTEKKNLYIITIILYYY